MLNFLTQNRELKEQNMTIKADLEWNKFLYREADGLNRILKKVLVQKNNKIADLEKRVADLEEQLAKKVFILDDGGTPIKSFTLTGKLTVMDEPAEELKVGKWYDARTFDVEKLKWLLPVGTLVEITTSVGADERRTSAPQDCIVRTIVTSVEKENNGAVVYVERYQYIENNWFKIIEE